jgi:hypothetical protein
LQTCKLIDIYIYIEVLSFINNVYPNELVRHCQGGDRVIFFLGSKY